MLRIICLSSVLLRYLEALQLMAVMKDFERKRHCWQCRRNCVVCDFTEPACRRCSAAGILCPGYSDIEPTRLKWLAPGKVLSRNHRTKNANVVGKSTAIVTASAQAFEPGRVDWKIPCLTTEQSAISALFQAAEYCKSSFLTESLEASN